LEGRPDSIGPVLTIREAATLLHVHLGTLRRWEKAGFIKPLRIGPRGHRRYPREQIEELIARAGGDNGVNGANVAAGRAGQEAR
jgi:excisionase family DNA binding protein